ncbi:alpha/beta fold hydrolase [Jiangella alkaliphila]|uniref:Pimeloyl-ACP methyl ester carboxylesterase n=2 Tax=Jiangella alkaliphila TaxID=419479 RepID=A0A1H2M6B9_9ACTN|nr:alpha/beta hydrolase [Jiangella alkaliphila]SDU88719.1 Pimeloyl-ACP methyl ester carboxylesterase [Jiangella alkaliphila]
MSRLVAAGRTAGLIGAWVGVATAGAAVGFAAERYAMGRSLKKDDPYADEPFGSLRGAARTVTTDDGVDLHVEVDEAPDARDAPTLVFCHGFALTTDAWHFQRRDLRGTARLVFWDQRGHGRSGPLPDDGELSFRRLGADLGQVLDEVVPKGPIVLIGHSMGGMTLQALAEDRPELFGKRVVAVALIATSGQKLDVSGLGLPGYLGRLAGRAAPAAVSILARKPELVERGRKMGSDLAYVLTRRYAFAEGGSPKLVEFTAIMNAAVPIDVVARFFPLFGELDAAGAIPVLSKIPVLVIGGERDQMTPVQHGRDLADALVDVEYIEATDAGHMVLLERHEVVTDALRTLIDRTRRGGRPRRLSSRIASVRRRRSKEDER